MQLLFGAFKELTLILLAEICLVTSYILTLGRVGPGDSGFVHDLLFDDDGPMAYHSAVHDAFGYLISYHKIGPGYNYTCAGAILESSSCVAGQISGINFWRDVLKKEKERVPKVTL